MPDHPLRIGTRKSVMALAQTDEVARLLRCANPGLNVEIIKFETRGDQDQTSKLLRHGGKGGAFVAEIRQAMRAGELQAAMHSLKDVPGNEETPGLVIAATLPRDAANDSLVLRPGLSLENFQGRARQGLQDRHQRGAPRGLSAPAVSGSHRDPLPRRRRHPDCKTRSRRHAAASRRRRGRACGCACDGALGPERIGMTSRIAHDFSVDEMLPSVGQGIVAVECVEKDWLTRGYLAKIEDLSSRLCAEAEREVLWVLNGHCNSPIAGHATISATT